MHSEVPEAVQAVENFMSAQIAANTEVTYAIIGDYNRAPADLGLHAEPDNIYRQIFAPNVDATHQGDRAVDYAIVGQFRDSTVVLSPEQVPTISGPTLSDQNRYTLIYRGVASATCGM